MDNTVRAQTVMARILPASGRGDKYGFRIFLILKAYIQPQGCGQIILLPVILPDISRLLGVKIKIRQAELLNPADVRNIRRHSALAFLRSQDILQSFRVSQDGILSGVKGISQAVNL